MIDADAAALPEGRMIWAPKEDAVVAAWAPALHALALFAVDPFGLGGVWLRARPSPARDVWLSALRAAAAPLCLRRAPARPPEDALGGGFDLAASLAAGRMLRVAGLFAGPEAQLFLQPMAERLTAGEGARLAAALEARAGALAFVALDEGAEPEEAPPAALTDRLAFPVTLEGLAPSLGRGRNAGLAPLAPPIPAPEALAAARRLLPQVRADDGVLRDLTLAAAAMGEPSLRAPSLALRAASAAAALAGRERIAEEDVALAAELVLAPRSRASAPLEPPATSEEAAEAAPRDRPPQEPDARGHDGAEAAPDASATPEEAAERMVAAARAALPPGLLEHLAGGAIRRAPVGAQGGRSGASRVGARRGRPLPSRRGRLGGPARIDLVATLRAAAPWRTLRRRAAPAGEARAVLIRAEDIHLKRYQEPRERAVLFVVDASGSTALARLAEAKGAVELMLGEAYARRDHVGLIAFRGAGAETLLPPTRSLVQTKRRLAALPGGGGTPIAAGLEEALIQARAAERRGMSVALAVLTDGRANLTRDGRANRADAAEEADAFARRIRAAGYRSVLIDAGARPQKSAARLAENLGAAYAPLPYMDARRVSAAVAAALSDGA
ncbi:MAG: magnesium chelatase subunit D [Pseudomonadota bacterium]